MILVLCDEADVSATWAADSLQKRGLSPMMLTGLDLASVRVWRHTVDRSGAAIAMRLQRFALDGREVCGVLNRLAFLPHAWLRGVSGPDRDYAMQEMLAFYLSWLHTLAGPKLNPPTPQGLCGNMRHPSAWVALAAAAGLPVRPFRQSSEDDPAASWRAPRGPAKTVFVVGTELIGPDTLIGPHGPACQRLAEAASCPLLGIDFAPGADGVWRMIAVSVTPNLTGGGERLADALARTLAP